MRYSGIGGQAVLEGVMMKNGDQYAVAVRRQDGQIEVQSKEYKGILRGKILPRIPLLRGVLNFIDSLVLGIETLMYSATFFDDEEEEEEKKGSRKEAKAAKKEAKSAKEQDTRSDHSKTADSKQQKKQDEKTDEHEISTGDKVLMGTTTVISFVIAIAIFVILPYYLSQIFQRVIPSQTLVAIIEGILRLVIFIVYIVLVSRTPDIKRVYMYHGAEHKCINCIEHGLDLTVDNVRSSSKEHKRCGTSFLMFVVIVSIILFIFIRVDTHLMRILVRLILVPVIAGLSYELLRAAGRSDNALINFISRPGLALQHLTTIEPDDDMIEVGIASVEAVFDWKSYVEEIRKEEA